MPNSSACTQRSARTSSRPEEPVRPRVPRREETFSCTTLSYLHLGIDKKLKRYMNQFLGVNRHFAIRRTASTRAKRRPGGEAGGLPFYSCCLECSFPFLNDPVRTRILLRPAVAANAFLRGEAVISSHQWSIRGAWQFHRAGSRGRRVARNSVYKSRAIY